MDKIKVGEKYGRLTVIENLHPKSEVVCRCECGTIKTLKAWDVYSLNTRSCGCLLTEHRKRLRYKHGWSETRLFNIWENMRARCYCKTNKVYKWYGGKGIKICDEWSEFIPFKDWAMLHGYTDDLTIDRINPDGDYEPLNCRWITKKEQQRNKTNSHYIEYKGEKKTVAEWAEILGMPYCTLHSRIGKKCNWDIEKAFTTPVKGRKNKNDND